MNYPIDGEYYVLKCRELEKIVAVLETKLELHEKPLNQEEKDWRLNWIKNMEEGLKSFKILYQAGKYYES